MIGIADSGNQEVTLINRSGSTFNIINEDTGASASIRILTGTGKDLELADNQAIKLQYSSNESRWNVIGGTGSGTGGSGGINYLEGTNSNFEEGLGDWTGDTNLPVALTTDSLRGDFSLLISKDAIDASSRTVKSGTFTVDDADLAKKLTISFDYDFSDANYSDGEMRVQITQDPSGTPKVIRVNGEDIKAGKGTQYCQFQTDSTVTDYRLDIYQVSTNAAAVSGYIDNVVVGPTNLAFGTIVTDSENFTPSGSPANATTTVSVMSRVGDRANISIKWNTTSGFGVVNSDDVLPSGHSIDVSKLVATQTGERGRFPVGKWHFADIGSNAYTGTLEYREDTDTFTMRSGIGTSLPTVGSDTVTYEISVPIQGWSSNTQMSEDLGGRDVVVSGEGNGAESITASITPITFNSTRDTTASWDGSTFTAPETGDYIYSGVIDFTTSLLRNVFCYVDGVINQLANTQQVSVVGVLYPFKGIVHLEKGQTFDIRTSSNGGTLDSSDIHTHWIHIQKLASPQTILETETVALRVRSTNGQSIGTASIIEFEDDY